MNERIWKKTPAAIIVLSIALALCISCATTITPEVQESYDWAQMNKICVVSVADLERSREISKALAHHLFEEGIPVVTKETDSVLDIFNAGREAKADVIAYGSVTRIEVTRSTTVYPPTTIKEVGVELQFIETATEKRIWKGSGSTADSANVKDAFLINELVGKMAHEILPTWTEIQRSSFGVTMLEIGDEAPPFQVSDVNGRPYALEDQLGKKIVVLGFWSFFCQPCKRTLHTLNAIHRRYQTRGVNVVAVSLEGEPMLSRIRTRIYQDRLEFTFLLDEPEGDKYEISDPYLVPGTPALYIIDKSGRIVFARAGRVTGDELAAVIDSELAKK